MENKFMIDDIVSVTEPGHTYARYTTKAVELGADVVGPKAKWKHNAMCSNGDVCEVTNIDETGQHILVERLSDGKQFLMLGYGLKVIERSMFKDEDFFI